MKSSFGLIRQKFTIWVDHEDLRCVKAFLPDGREFGMLLAHGFWGKRPHNLKTRRLVLALRRRKEIFFSDKQDWYEIYQEYLQKRGTKSKRAASEMLRQRRLQTEAAPSSQLSSAVNNKTDVDDRSSLPPLDDFLKQFEIDPSDVL